MLLSRLDEWPLQRIPRFQWSLQKKKEKKKEEHC
jgi:hypothetical protein